MSTTTLDRVQLPGAENFSKFLEERFGERLTVEPQKGFGEYNFWRVLVDNLLVGRYLTVNKRLKEKDYQREFRTTKVLHLPDLIYSDHRIAILSVEEGARVLGFKKTPWQRQDGNKDIPFP